MTTSTISTVKKKKKELRSVQVAEGTSRLNSSRCNITERIETLLLVWINGKRMAGDNVSEAIICEKSNNCLRNLVLRLLVQVLVL